MDERTYAIEKLTERYREQCIAFPLTARNISLDMYLRRNVRTLIRNWHDQADWIASEVDIANS